MSAKVDHSAVQDGYELYHHNFFFTSLGRWCVVQQGMNDATGLARRYHWLGEAVNDFVCEPHQAICAQARAEVLNLVDSGSAGTRRVSALLSREHPDRIFREIRNVDFLNLPRRHGIREGEDIASRYLYKILLKTYERQPENFESLLGTEGVGAKTLRALSLIGELIYGEKPSFRDPARFSFAHGGKDGIPYPVDRRLYDQSIELLRKGLARSRLDSLEKDNALKRLVRFYGPASASARTRSEGGR
jgi:hypothetical protein